jgi:UDP-2,3-diacylglucosamine hydrolase
MMSSERAELIAPSHWRVIDFISDLHLQASEPETFNAWTNYLQTTQADALFILGDLFEVWVGDDVAAPTASTPDTFERQCASHLRTAAKRLDIFFMHGNRDFLVGQSFLRQCRASLLNDPTTLFFGEQRWLLSHGDELCLADTEYQQFRKLVRSNAWQTDFLSKPLAERQTIARGLRAQSEARKKLGLKLVDVDAAMSTQWLRDRGSSTLIHGHTHQPADHDLGQGLQRIVMSDWDVAAKPPRAQVLRLSLSASPGVEASPTLNRYYINSELSILFVG